MLDGSQDLRTSQALPYSFELDPTSVVRAAADVRVERSPSVGSFDAQRAGPGQPEMARCGRDSRPPPGCSNSGRAGAGFDDPDSELRWPAVDHVKGPQTSAPAGAAVVCRGSPTMSSRPRKRGRARRPTGAPPKRGPKVAGGFSVGTSSAGGSDYLTARGPQKSGSYFFAWPRLIRPPWFLVLKARVA